ncbi:MAG: hypothetical protein ACI4S3_00985 [Candidatus Gastranaerophilaceae bacterium]
MEKIINSCNVGYSPNINQKGVKNLASTTSRVNLSQRNNDVFFGALNKKFVMSKAKSVKDIHSDANIFIFSCKNKVNLPEGRYAKECILTEKGFGFWKKFFGGNEANTVNLKCNTVGYVHGEATDMDKTCGILNANNCKISQIDNISNVRLTNHSNIGFVNQVDELNVQNSKVMSVNDVKLLNIEGNSQVDNISVNNISTAPGTKIKKVSSENLLCKADPNSPDKYTEIGEADIQNGAEIYQSKIKNLKTKELIIKDSLVDNLQAEGCLEFDNSVVKNLDIYDIKKISNCKASNILLKGYDPEICLHGKTQIDNFNIKGSNVKFFVFPKKEWDKPVDNYIKKINILSEYAESEKPRVKIQGDIDIDTIEFVKDSGIVEMTIPEIPEKRINVINGFIKYGSPLEEVPKLEDLG